MRCEHNASKSGEFEQRPKNNKNSENIGKNTTILAKECQKKWFGKIKK